ncbi:MAG TPA: EF-P lysine aminoacylase GenX [Thiothrix sp.]|nr:EF-P lysine aminoacylase GenX [Thiothrix sp.]
MDLAILTERAQMLHDIRDFFYARQVLEVETPALSQAGNTDPAIDSFSVDIGNTNTNSLPLLRYLHTSPEYFMKRLLVAGAGDIYQIAKVWRKEEQGVRHNPEFTMLEWYRIGFSYHQLMREVETLLLLLLPCLNESSCFITYQQAFLEKLNIDPHSATHTELRCCMQNQAIDIIGELDRSAILDVLMTHCIEPHFAQDRLTFVYDYPVIQQALASVAHATKTALPVAERFEVYSGCLELANGYQEQVDAVVNRAVLQQDAAMRMRLGKTTIPVDELFLQAMEQGMPAASGVALGLDRVLMQRLHKERLEDVLSFPWTMA